MKRILVAPLNWGLGHAARCVPLVRALEKMGAQVLLASDGSALQLLRAEFPHLPSFAIPSYRIRYQSNSMIWNIARQMPRITYAIRAEQWATERIVQSEGVQGILSDNRYGCFSRRADSVLLTHQLHLRVPNGPLEWAANQVLRRAFRKFDHIWVPDVPHEASLSGALSHPRLKKFDIQYIGVLTRMRAEAAGREYDVAVVLSGPEPQRTFLEQILLEQAMSLPQKFIFVQGKTKTKSHHFAAENVEVVSYLTSQELNRVLAASGAVVCRSGYTSLMDLAMLGKKALLVPTPGQTEQEYLAAFLSEKNAFLSQKQENIDLESGLAQLEKTSGIPLGQFDSEDFLGPLEDWLRAL
jgi:UDP:flavonoid glycosyltransferase YjiC (YdhE family)